MAYSSIAKPGDYFNTVLYAGNGSTNNITGVGFQPDWVWIKNRSNTSSHNTFDVVRGATKGLFTNATDAEETVANRLSAFGSDGFTINGDTSNQTNASGSNFVSWNWLAGGATSSNSDGSITSTVSANTTAGFSIVSYTGTGSLATVGHGLGVVPAMILTKNRSSTYDWNGLHKSLTGTNGIFLNTTSASTSSSSFWNNTNPTSLVFSLGSHVTTNNSGDNMIAYCFAEKQGYSKFGSYTGNGNADGAFVYTGFRPAWVMVKRTDSASEWSIYDTTRKTFNVGDLRLEANSSSAEDSHSVNYHDILSNGFKMRNSDAARNGSGNSYIYMAFAENPFVGNVSGTAVPVVAR